MHILIQLHKNRGLLGVCTTDTAPPFSCAVLGQSDLTAAKAHKNPDRNPLQIFGNIPTGVYNVHLTDPASDSPTDQRSFGPNKRLVLDPVSGDALLAKHNGRFGELCHGGAPGPTGGLRPTHGCIRFSDANIKTLCDLVELAQGQVVLQVIEL